MSPEYTHALVAIPEKQFTLLVPLSSKRPRKTMAFLNEWALRRGLDVDTIALEVTQARELLHDAEPAWVLSHCAVMVLNDPEALYHTFKLENFANVY